MKFLLNGQVTEYDGDPDLDLMTFLREEQEIISPKNGCAPQAACGCCVVQLNDKAVLSCVTKMSRVAEGEVTTTEGLGEYRQKVLTMYEYSMYTMHMLNKDKNQPYPRTCVIKSISLSRLVIRMRNCLKSLCL
jgi:aerobic-type carbon monoxide dehydrogenase small subunit (CoxS/CutS family)